MWLLRLHNALKARNFTLLLFEIISFVEVSYTHAHMPTHTHTHTPYCRCHHHSGKTIANITVLKLLKPRQNSISKKVTACEKVVFPTLGVTISVSNLGNITDCQERKISTEPALHNERQLYFKRINGDGGGLNCFQLDVHFFYIKDNGKKVSWHRI